jgi:hypothetical protein
VMAPERGAQRALAPALRRSALRAELEAAGQLLQQLQQAKVRSRGGLDPMDAGFRYPDGAAAHRGSQDRLELAKCGLSFRDPGEVILIQVQQQAD